MNLGYIFSGFVVAPYTQPNCFNRLSVFCTVSGAYSQSLLQGLKLGPFVLTNVMTCKLFLARKSSLRDLIFGLVSPVGAHTRAGAVSQPPPLLGPPSAGS